MGEINLRSSDYYPNDKMASERFTSLIGLEVQKQQLLENLKLIVERTEISEWKKKYHPKALSFLDQHFKISPMILLSGDVGCGKTELASCIAGPLALYTKKMVRVYEAPSDIRGKGLVGELSGRITATFDQIIEDLGDEEVGILIMDEADALANSRENDQQHHEDRAGVNTLIKELDRIEQHKSNLAVLFITNRTGVMDPAIIRRAAVEIVFNRPMEAEIREVINVLTQGIMETDQANSLVKECLKKEPLFTYSDLFRKVAYQSVIRAYSNGRALAYEDLFETIRLTPSSPTFTEL